MRNLRKGVDKQEKMVYNVGTKLMKDLKKDEVLKMKNYTFIRVMQNGKLINSYIYKTDSHALALHQLKKDYPCFKRSDIVCVAMTIDVEGEEKFKSLYEAHECCGCVGGVSGW